MYNEFEDEFHDVTLNVPVTHVDGVCALCDKKIPDDSEECLYIGRKMVCTDCAGKLMRLYSDNGELALPEYRIPGNNGLLMKPLDIKAELDKYVVGQERAKIVLSTAVYNHQKRIAMKNTSIEKSNILLCGPTGSGKTYIIKTLAKILNIPLVIVDATTLTEAGYVGADVESMIEKLFVEAEFDATKAGKGIIFIDEIDKLSNTADERHREVGKKGVQQALLKLLEGTKVNVQAAEGMFGSRKTVMVDTTNILFICGGAFPDVLPIIKKRLHADKSVIGFNSCVAKQDCDDDNLMLDVTSDDLREFGMIPELLGRLPIVVPMEDVSCDMLKHILVEPKNSIISQYKQLMECDGVRLEFDEDALDIIAKSAFEKKTGARGLRSIMEDVLLKVMYEAPSCGGSETITVTREYLSQAITKKRAAGAEI